MPATERLVSKKMALLGDTPLKGLASIVANPFKVARVTEDFFYLLSCEDPKYRKPPTACTRQVVSQT